MERELSTRVGMVSHWYDPEGGAAAQPGVIARSLAAKGHRVEVVTGFPNYPHGRLHEDYRLGRYRYEFRDGVHVHRTWLYPSHDRSAVRRAANYLSFGASSVPASLQHLRDVDVSLVYASPATTAFAAMALQARYGIPYVVHVPDLWPDSVLLSGFLSPRQTRAAASVLHRYLDRVYSAASAVTVTSPGQAERICARGVPEAKLHFVPNWVDEQAFRPRRPDPALRASLGLSSEVLIMYAGNLGTYQDLETLIRAAELLRDDDSIGFVLVGDGVERPNLERRVAASSLRNVAFLGAKRYAEMPDFLALGDLHVVSLQNLPLFEHTLPSKLAATMASGKPVLASLSGDGAHMVTEAGAGYVVSPETPAAMADAIRSFRDASPDERSHLGVRAADYYRQHLSSHVVAERLSQILDAAARRKKLRHD